MATPAAREPHPVADLDGREVPYPDTRGQILAATERLLETTSLSDLNVAAILTESHISRATFYVYFNSKFGPVAALLEHTMDAIYDSVTAFTSRDGDGTNGGPAALDQGLEGAANLFRDHRMVLRAVVEHWHEVPELRTLWLGVMDRFTEAFAAEIDRERAAGHAPPGLPSRELAASLIWSSERCLYIAGLGVTDDMPHEDRTLLALQTFWRGAVYGTPG
jgi:AcrR family transcriptional regulator